MDCSFVNNERSARNTFQDLDLFFFLTNLCPPQVISIVSASRDALQSPNAFHLSSHSMLPYLYRCINLLF